MQARPPLVGSETGIARRYAANRLSEAGGGRPAAHAVAFPGLAERERELTVLSREQDNFRAALEWSLAPGVVQGLISEYRRAA
jgi:hypothetical protein